MTTNHGWRRKARRWRLVMYERSGRARSSGSLLASRADRPGRCGGDRRRRATAGRRSPTATRDAGASSAARTAGTRAAPWSTRARQACGRRSTARRAPSTRASGRRGVTRPRPGRRRARRDRVAAQLGLQLVGRAPGDDLPAVDDRDLARQLVGLLEVVGRQQDRQAVLARGAAISAHSSARASGSRPVVGSSRNRTRGWWTRPDRHVELALHAAGPGLDDPVGRVGEAERARAARRRARRARAPPRP